MTEDLQTACPEAEELAEYVDGRLNGGARARLEAHLADCEVCRQVVAETVILLPQAVIPFWRRPRVRAAAGGALALAASVVAALLVAPQLNPFRGPTAYDELVAAVGTQRTVEARLTGGFQYGPLRSPTRSGSSQQSDYGVLAAAAKIQQEAQDEGSAENLHALGVARLLTGDPEGGIDALQRAADLEPGHAEYQSDLAAALLSRGRLHDNANDFSLAARAAERAIEANPSLIEAYFNHALALDALGRSDASKKAWQEYLARDTDSGWAAEVRRNFN